MVPLEFRVASNNSVFSKILFVAGLLHWLTLALTKTITSWKFQRDGDKRCMCFDLAFIKNEAVFKTDMKSKSRGLIRQRGKEWGGGKKGILFLFTPLLKLEYDRCCHHEAFHTHTHTPLPLLLHFK